MHVLSGVIGVLILIGLAYLLSEQRSRINWRTVLGALAIQVTFASIVLYSPMGRDALTGFSNVVQDVINYSNNGIDFLFGGLVSDKMFALFGGGGFVFALRVLPVVVFFSALVSVLYYFGIMQFIVNTLGRALSYALGTSRPESISATANIFLGISEAPLTIRPYLKSMTPFTVFRGNGRRHGIRSGFGTGWLRTDGYSSGLLVGGVFHGGTGGSSYGEADHS
ncbi:nucleoside permease NupC [Photobacterium aphoticum]|uniref:Nucleoside permease NupC n=1 Tax=Photobacterium aphoticum TaxID=754436 RepID=A0A090QZ16_9GAMM|nr:nucleoside permease NupC [Photobacterium aphoticum]